MNEPKRGDKIGDWTITRVIEETEDCYILGVERVMGEKIEQEVIRIKK